MSESYVGGKLVEEKDLVLNRLKAHLGVFAYAMLIGIADILVALMLAISRSASSLSGMVKYL